ncbi:MAG: magnesium/cobalt transporter CorA [candidate division WOR-3 bacterium]|nr:MAG: magnesium/cobalt transporter CorA [candidate division WOR-3 bacterium]
MKLFRSRTKAAGLAPGTPVYVGTPRTGDVSITVFDFVADRVDERRSCSVDECLPLRDTSTVSWVDVDGVHDADKVQRLCEHFGIHPLVVEDIVHTVQRPKVEDHGDYVYIVVRMLQRDQAGELRSEQVSLLLGPHWVLSFQEEPGDVFEPVRNRIRTGNGRVRKSGPDYLAYALLDAVVDHYFAVFEPYSERIEAVEQQLSRNPDPELLESIHQMKRELIGVRRAVWPLREALSGLIRAESGLIGKQTNVFLRDVYDHAVQVIDTVEAFRDTVSGLLDLYLSSVSNRMNEVMKVLTIIATIFIPLTFVAGIYGMNFRFMPELGWHWGYFGALGLMAAVAVVMVIFFRRKRWL